MAGANPVMTFPWHFLIQEYPMASNNQDNEGSKKGSSNRGFASMDPQRQREIASEGGRAAHEKGTAHEFTSEEAREAGRKGGQARSQSNRSNSNRGNSGSSSSSER
ncbi:MAG TPA: KGG domain-containing protein [Ramlibacter sp.]|jgi:general stress protein YciG|nr:KGG domain-containing protein [Ramlibacter sp.]